MIRIGTSGWVYGDWRGRFYPSGLGQSRWLGYYAERFNTVELNATTYRLPKPEQVRRWCDAVPSEFLYTIKLSRLITHRKTLPGRVDEFIENYMHRAACFDAGKVAQILVQFPPFLERNDDYLRAFLDKLPPHHRYAVEFRHSSWLVESVNRILTERGMAFCVHDYPGCRTENVVTCAQLAYVRLHGYTALYAGNYPRRSLLYWARRIDRLAQQAQDVYVYFNNDVAAAAPHDARLLREIVAKSISLPEYC